MFGVELIKKCVMVQIKHECDSQVAVRHFLDNADALAPFGNLVHHFKHETQGLHVMKLGMFRMQNSVADRLATYGNSLNESIFWLDGVILDCIMFAVSADLPC